MSNRNPKEIGNKLDRVISAWESLASGKSFGGMTLGQFKTVVAPSQTARQNLDNLENQMKQEFVSRDQADEVSLVKAQLVINGILADATEGPDSALYAAMGYTRKSDRQSGLTRKSNRAPAPHLA
jgi:hypothetical protein